MATGGIFSQSNRPNSEAIIWEVHKFAKSAKSEGFGTNGHTPIDSHQPVKFSPTGTLVPATSADKIYMYAMSKENYQTGRVTFTGSFNGIMFVKLTESVQANDIGKFVSWDSAEQRSLYAKATAGQEGQILFRQSGVAGEEVQALIFNIPVTA